MKTFIYSTLVIILFSGCADVSPHSDVCLTSNPYGFLSGIWHGLILPISFIISLISDDVAIYAYNNNGFAYDFGFISGLYLLYKIIEDEKTNN